VISLGERQTDHINPMKIISKLTYMFIRYERLIWDLSIRTKLIPFTD